jgi:hypothetical protein
LTQERQSRWLAFAFGASESLRQAESGSGGKWRKKWGAARGRVAFGLLAAAGRTPTLAAALFMAFCLIAASWVALAAARGVALSENRWLAAPASARAFSHLAPRSASEDLIGCAFVYGKTEIASESCLAARARQGADPCPAGAGCRRTELAWSEAFVWALGGPAPSAMRALAPKAPPLAALPPFEGGAFFSALLFSLTVVVALSGAIELRRAKTLDWRLEALAWARAAGGGRKIAQGVKAGLVLGFWAWFVNSQGFDGPFGELKSDLAMGAALVGGLSLACWWRHWVCERSKETEGEDLKLFESWVREGTPRAERILLRRSAREGSALAAKTSRGACRSPMGGRNGASESDEAGASAQGSGAPRGSVNEGAGLDVAALRSGPRRL